MRKVFTVAYCGHLVGIFSNRKLTWEAILKTFNTNKQELKEKVRSITCEYIISGDPRRLRTCRVGISKRVSSLPSLTSLLLKSDHLVLRDITDRNEKITIQMIYVNDLDLPKINEDY